MSEEIKATETKVETIATQPETVTPQTVTEVDYEAELAKKDAELKQIQGEKENYRKAYLKKAKGQPEEDDNSSNDENIDSKVKRLVQEELLQTREAQAIAEKDALVLASAKKIKELTLALKNRGQISGTGQGSNQDRPEGRTDNVLSNEQLSALKARGFDDKKIEEFKKNLSKGTQAPK